MCGFAGEFVFRGQADLSLARAMAATLAHRGPDEEGAYISPDGRLAVGTRRLCVIDPPGSKQPMASSDGQLAVAFNGEIYNHRELREGLIQRSARFATSGDTEVLLHLYRQHGKEFVSLLSGMFALCLYDARSGELLLARDRLGQKPLWYAALTDRLIFASEAKAILAHPVVPQEMDRKSITLFLSVGCVTSTGSIWSGIRKIPPACLLRCGTGISQEERYWELPRREGPELSVSEATEQIRTRLEETVRLHMVSDVPLGVLLSGGVDSSIITALMCKSAGRAGGVRTFTAGFSDARYDERPAARRVAAHCGTDHTELLVRPEPKNVLDWVVNQYDEPFGDSSALPTFLVCQAARQHVTVALGGDGGDEVFAGYDRYRAMFLGQRMRPWEYMLVKLASGLARPFAPNGERSRLRRLVRFADALSLPPAIQYFRYRCLFRPEDLLRLLTPEFLSEIDVDEPMEWFCRLWEEGEFNDDAANAQLHDLRTYLPDDLLVKADIASMAASLELRCPMLDHRVVELGLALPFELKLNRRRGKLALEKAFSHLLPHDVFRRSKKGFGVPLGKWLRNELREEMVETLTDPSVKRTGILREDALVGLMNDHLSNREDHSHRLWSLMVLGRWLAKWAK